MNLKESTSAVEDSTLCTADETYNTMIKDEPLDIPECPLNDFKSEIEDFDIDIKDEPLFEEDANSVSEINVGNIIEKNTADIIKESSNNITKNNVPVTRKLIIHGQERTCILVKNPALIERIRESNQRARTTLNNLSSPNKELCNKTVTDFMITSPDKSGLIDHTYSLIMVTCSICFSVVDMNKFKQHIKSCLPRKTYVKKVSSDEANEHNITSSYQIVYNDYTGEVVASSNNMNISNNNKKSKDLEIKSPKNDNHKSVCLEIDLSFPLHSEQFQNNDGIKNHFSEESSDQIERVCRYNCDLCSYVTRKFSDLEVHKTLHVKKMRIVQCDKCAFRSTKRALEAHKRKHKSEKTLKKVESNTEGSLVSQENMFSCSICSFTTCEQMSLGLHLKTHQFEPIERMTEFGGIKYDCRMCSFSRQTFSNITTHINCHKRNLPIRKCPKCDFKSTACALAKHIQRCKKKNTAKSTENCEEENRKLRTSQNRVEFSESDKVSSEKSLKCMACSFLTCNELKLRVHLKKKHHYELIKQKDSFGRPVYHCELCSYSNQKFTAIISHMNFHERNISIEKCPYCDFKSITKVLICHIRNCGSKTKVHEEKRLFEPVKGTDSLGDQRLYCKMCSYDSNRWPDIFAHIESHKRNEPIVSCSYCDFKSTLTAVEHHQTKCKSTSVEINKHTLEEAAEQNSVDGFERNEMSFESEETNSDLQNGTKTDVNLLDVERTEVVSNENSLQSFEPDEDLSEDRKKDLFKPKFLQTSSGSKYFQCKCCSYGDRSCRVVISHINTHKKKLPILNCFNNCGFKSTIFAINRHMTKCRVNAPGNVFKCTVCAFSTSLRLKLKLHMKKRHFNNLFSCALCSYFTQYKTSYKVHMKRHKKCPYCSFEALSAVIKAHVLECAHKPKFLVGFQKYNCKLCSYNTSSRQNYSYHVNAHARGESIEKCAQCDFMSTRKALARHRVSKRHFMIETTGSVKCITSGEPKDNDEIAVKMSSLVCMYPSRYT